MKNSTAIIAILDKSGSMMSLKNDTIGSFNSFLREQKAIPGDVTMTLALFSDRYDLVHRNVPLHEVLELTEQTYNPSGGTALLDAIGKTFDSVGRDFAALPEDQKIEKVLVLLISDGEENSSTDFRLDQIKEMIKHQQEKYSWSIVYVGANVDAFKVSGGLGVSTGSTYSYTPSAHGTRSLYSSISIGTSVFRNAAAGGTFSMADPTQTGPVVSPTVSIIDEETLSTIDTK